MPRTRSEVYQCVPIEDGNSFYTIRAVPKVDEEKLSQMIEVFPDTLDSILKLFHGHLSDKFLAKVALIKLKR